MVSSCTFEARKKTSPLLGDPMSLYRYDGDTVFRYVYSHSTPTADYYQFTHRPWEGWSIPGDPRLFGPVYIPSGLLEVQETRCILSFRPEVSPNDEYKLLLFDFALSKGETVPLIEGKIENSASLTLDELFTHADELIYKFRVRDWGMGDSDWIYYATKKRGIIGTYVSCPEDGHETVLTYFGWILEDDLKYFRHEVHGDCNIVY